MALFDVCHVNLAKGFRGGERQTELLVKGLAEHGFVQAVVLRSGAGLERRLAEVPKVGIRPVGSSLLHALRASRGARLLHAHEGRAVHVGYLRKLLSRTPYVVTRRVNHPPGSDWFTRRVYRNADAIIGLSQAVRRTLAAYQHGMDARIIPSALSRLRRDPDNVRRLRARYPGKFVVGHIGALDQATKGQLFLIQAARAIEVSHPDIHFLFVGEGRDEALLRGEAEKLRNVSFIGFSDHVGDWLSTFDLFAFPSLQEGLGSILLDALDFALPVVASDVGGIPDVISHGENGLLVPPANPAALKNAILALYSDNGRRNAMSRAASEAAGHYTAERMVDAYLEVYRSIVPGLGTSKKRP
ncbi:MAG: glycosyltransferase family 4 protein [Gammaproteobacteria bacterium]|nr:glycosyltransferase family 4 protein [Gammaproteobacteria bacterium]